jgi:hypothetical protein
MAQEPDPLLAAWSEYLKALAARHSASGVPEQDLLRAGQLAAREAYRDFQANPAGDPSRSIADRVDEAMRDHIAGASRTVDTVGDAEAGGAEDTTPLPAPGERGLAQVAGPGERDAPSAYLDRELAGFLREARAEVNALDVEHGREVRGAVRAADEELTAPDSDLNRFQAGADGAAARVQGEANHEFVAFEVDANREVGQYPQPSEDRAGPAEQSATPASLDREVAGFRIDADAEVNALDVEHEREVREAVRAADEELTAPDSDLNRFETGPDGAAARLQGDANRDFADLERRADLEVGQFPTTASSPGEQETIPTADGELVALRSANVDFADLARQEPAEDSARIDHRDDNLTVDNAANEIEDFDGMDDIGGL